MKAVTSSRSLTLGARGTEQSPGTSFDNDHLLNNLFIITMDFNISFMRQPIKMEISIQFPWKPISLQYIN